MALCLALRPAGAETVLHQFQSGSNDGAGPAGRLLYANGLLYGTTQIGGNGFGTLYSLTLSGQETLLHAFQPSEGGIEVSALTLFHGAFYGVSTRDGTYFGGGVYKWTPKHGLKTVVSFAGNREGLDGYSGLTELGGKLYGTTFYGGGYYGLVYEITP